MWLLIKNEWKFLGRSKVMLAISLSMVLVLLLSVGLGIYLNRVQSKSVVGAQEHLREQWESLDAMNPHGAAHYGTYVFKPSGLLSALDDGVYSVTGKVLRIEGHVQNEMVHSEASQMQSISRFGRLNSSLLLKYIVPMLMIFLAFSAVSSEKQSGRLKMMVIQGTSIRQLVLAKTLAIWLFGIGLLSLVVGINIGVNFAQLDGDTWQRTGLFFGAYALYYFILSALTVFFSARWQNTTLALTSMLGIWMLWTIFLPHLFLSSVERWHPLPSRNAFQTAMKEDRAQGIDGHNPVDERKAQLEKEILAKYGVDSLHKLPINFDGIVMQADEEYGNQVWDKHFGQLDEVLQQQKRSLQWGGLINPFISLQNASMGFTGTDNLHHQDYLLQAETYRRSLIKQLNDEHAYGGSKTGEWGWTADNEFFRSVPDFEYQATRLSAVLGNYVPDIGSLLFWTGLTLGLLILGTQRIALV